MAEAREQFERARRPGEKTARREAILQATARLLDRLLVQEISLNQIAQEVGLTKPNLYRYFESREDILLTIFNEELSAFEDAVVSGLEAMASVQTPEAREAAVATVLVDAYAGRPRLCRFLGMIASVFEHNVSATVVEASKRATLAQAIRVATALRMVLPELTLERCLWLNNMTALLVAGLWPPAHPAAAVQAVLAKPEFQLLRPDFRRDLGTFVETLIRGSRA